MTRSLFLRKFNLTTNVRRLGRWLLDRFGPPRWAAPVPIRDDGPIDDGEFAFLSALASEHEELHTVDMAIEGQPVPRRCEDYGRACRSLGVARALRLGLDGITNVRRRKLLGHVAASVTDAAIALAEADRALALYFGKKSAPREQNAASGNPTDAPSPGHPVTVPSGASARVDGAGVHGAAVAYMLHDHEHACILPATLRVPVRELHASLRRFAALGLGPAIAAHRERTARPGRKRRPPVLALVEEALSDEGFTHREVVELIDDGYGGTVAQRIDRMRKAIAAERMWRSMSDAERGAALGRRAPPEPAPPDALAARGSKPATDPAGTKNRNVAPSGPPQISRSSK
jgi:hypothetical protein